MYIDYLMMAKLKVIKNYILVHTESAFLVGNALSVRFSVMLPRRNARACKMLNLCKILVANIVVDVIVRIFEKQLHRIMHLLLPFF